MKLRNLHKWEVPIEEAKSIQRELAGKIYLQNQFSEIGLIAGTDMSIDEETMEGIAGVVIFTFPGLEIVERKYARRKITYPYIPGLLSFREAPILLSAFEKIEHEPDLVIFDGQGIAHPRRLGIASHMGIILDKPAIGCAKSLLCGEYIEPAKKMGSISSLFDGDKTIGVTLRSRDNVHPIFISPGHKIDLDTSLKIILACCDGYRIPKPTRIADHYVEEVKRHTHIRN